MGGSFMVVFSDNHLGTSMPGAGAVHPIKTFEIFIRFARNFIAIKWGA
jgi:hypothetical protein